MDSSTIILFVHLIGLALGAGAAFVLDLVILKFCVTDRITSEKVQIIEFATRVTIFGLVVLWVSGFLFLFKLSVFNPVGLENPKIWAKVSIVVFLTINGMYIHRVILPAIRNNIGSTIFEGVSSGKQRLMLASGAISTVSWLTPIVLGSLRGIDLGKSFADSYLTFMGVYLAVLMVGVTSCVFLGRWFVERHISGKSAVDSQEHLVAGAS